MFDAFSNTPGSVAGDDSAPPGMGRIAVIGSGIGGLSAAWLLSQRYRVTLFEAAPRLGGHSHTVDVAVAGGARVAVDAGFIVYNERTYPNLTALFGHLGVATQPSDMSFSVSIGQGRREYAAGRRLAGLFGQPANLADPVFLRMLADIVRFYRGFRDGGDAALADLTLGDLVARGRYSRAFRDEHLLPMAAAIWSGSFASILDFPATTFLAFCRNHGLLQLRDRPRWRTVTGGSREYVRRLAAGISGPIHAGAPVAGLRRSETGVEIVLQDGRRERFDHCVVGTHADQALRLLETPTAAERQVLGAFAFQRNLAILHRDPALMPRRRACWASWNAMVDGNADPAAPAFITYWMNRLQNIDPASLLFLSLNPTRMPRADSIVAQFDYSHPQFGLASVAAQARLPSIQGARRVWFAGAWCGYGFHEDGLNAGIAVAAGLGVGVPWAPVAASPAVPDSAPLAAAA